MRVSVEDLDGAKFSKLCRDAKLLGKHFGSIDVDIVFAKVKVRITFYIKLCTVIQPGMKKCLKLVVTLLLFQSTAKLHCINCDSGQVSLA